MSGLFRGRLTYGSKGQAKEKHTQLRPMQKTERNEHARESRKLLFTGPLWQRKLINVVCLVAIEPIIQGARGCHDDVGKSLCALHWDWHGEIEGSLTGGCSGPREQESCDRGLLCLLWQGPTRAHKPAGAPMEIHQCYLSQLATSHFGVCSHRAHTNFDFNEQEDRNRGDTKRLETFFQGRW
jgi:hypothetical protein